MQYITPSILLALVTLGGAIAFLARYVRPQWGARGLRPGKAPVCDPPARLSFAGKLHPMEKKDRLPILLITAVYALTAFFQLGDMTAPQDTLDFVQLKSAGVPSVTIRVEDSPVCAAGIRYYSGLGTGKYNVEVSFDGEHWSTLWTRTEKDQWDRDTTVYFWADAEDLSPSYALEQGYNQLFKWIDVTVENPLTVRYLRITGKADGQTLQLAKLCLLGRDGAPVSFQWTWTDLAWQPKELDPPLSLFSTEGVPEKSTWHNSTYFDEIYHARTAKEHIDNIYPYEVTHPPLGKLIIGLGIRLFGMTPFGWRFSGTLFGVLMLPLLYVFLKNMFGKTAVAACGTTLFAAEFMHLTQTRIATIDTYAVFFILGMYFFLYRYLTLPAGTPFRKGALPLFLSGLMWGLGAASKWTVFYAGVGLAVVYFMGLYQKLRDWPEQEAYPVAKAPWLCATLLFSVLCFVLIPFAIYTTSYLPYAAAKEASLSLKGLFRDLGMLLGNVLGRGKEGFSAQYIPQDNLAGIMTGNQWYMFNYHSGVTSPHPYASWWFQWIVDGRPILYYMDNTVSGHTTRFAAFSNPVVCWTGLGAILICAAHSFRRLWSKAAFLGGLGVFAALVTAKVQQTPNGIFDPDLPAGETARNWVIFAASLLLYLAVSWLLLQLAPGHDGRAAFLLVAFLSQLVPWWFIGRTTFEYHYFPSLLFLVFAIAYLMNGLVETAEDWKTPVYGLTGLAVGLYALFYPVLIGLQIPTWYEPLVQWLKSWPF